MSGREFRKGGEVMVVYEGCYIYNMDFYRKVTEAFVGKQCMGLRYPLQLECTSLLFWVILWGSEILQQLQFRYISKDSQ